MPEATSYDHILAHWHLEYHKLRPEIIISGSPERTAYRIVVEDMAGRLWLLEKLLDRQRKHKLAIIQLLNQLNIAGYPYVVPYLPTPDGAYLIRQASDFWQVVPYIEGVDLLRPDYAFDKWRSPLIAKGLLDLKTMNVFEQAPIPNNVFSIVDYVTQLSDTISSHNPVLMSPLRPIVDFLKTSFFSFHNALPVRLCHGDYHPVNIIWGEKDIRAIIDWEFFGLKPEAYDLANMLGCLGMEDPGALYGPLVMDLIEVLRAETYLETKSWASLLELMLSIRFAWLSEWLRKKDTEMIRLELTYMYLLMDHREEILKKWKLV